MQFDNPIVGGVTLIREAIQSDNFASTDQGVTGWQIKRDGSATFTDITIGTTNYTIDANGNAVFNSVNSPSIIYNGTELSSQLSQYSQGILGIVTLSGSTGVYTTTNVKFAEIVIPNFDPTRQYSVGWSSCYFSTNNTAAGTYLIVRVRLAWDTTVGVADTLLASYEYGHESGSASGLEVGGYHPFNDSTPGGTNAHIGLFFETNNTAMNCQSATGSRVFTVDEGPIVTYSSYDMGTGVPPVQTYTKTYSTTSTHVFQGDGSNRDAYASGHIYQGQYSSTNGNQFSILNFDYTTIASDLSGATITKTEVYLDNVGWYYNSGGTAIIGYASAAAGSGNYTYSNVTSDVNSFSGWAVGAGKWVTVSNTIGNAFKSGSAHALALGKGPSTSLTYYGYFRGHSESNPPQLRITYQK